MLNSGAYLGNIDILRNLLEDKIGIHPIERHLVKDILNVVDGCFSEKSLINAALSNLSQLQGCSYDVSLDEYFIRVFDNNLQENKFDKFILPCGFSSDIFPELSICSEDLKKFEIKNFDSLQSFIYPIKLYHSAYFREIIANKNYILLPPKERVLATTKEKIGSKCCEITSQIASKSSWARHGLEVCSCAGFGDPHYYNHWTLEIFNKNIYPVLLIEGMLIAQVYFTYVKDCEKIYTSKYNNLGEDKVYSRKERISMMIPKPIKII